MSREIKIGEREREMKGGKMMVSVCDEVGNGGAEGRHEGRRGVGCPWIRPRYNLICGSRKQ